MASIPLAPSLWTGPLLWAAALLPAVPQAGPPDGAPGDGAPGDGARGDGTGGGAWELHNTVDAIVEGQIITRRQVLSSIYGPDSDYTISSLADLEEARRREIERAIQRSLRVQAGDALGRDRLPLDQHVRRLDAQQRHDMGLFEYQEYLAEKDLDPETNREQLRSDLNETLWEQSVTGVGAGAAGRKTRDLYLRPGQLRILYEENLDQLRDPLPAARFRILVVQAAAAGGLENARAVCEEERAAIRDGKAFERSVEEYGSELRDRGGDAGWVELARISHAGLQAFLKGAALGDVSEVLDAYDPRTGEVVGAQILRLVERDPGGEPAPFEDPRIQSYLRRVHEQRLRGRLLERAEGELQRQAFIWLRERAPEPGR